MKKKYATPVVAIEYYELTQTIASCTTKIGFLDSNCVKEDRDSTEQMKDLAWVGFFTAEGMCDGYASGMDGTDSICYHTNMNAAFSS